MPSVCVNAAGRFHHVNRLGAGTEGDVKALDRPAEHSVQRRHLPLHLPDDWIGERRRIKVDQALRLRHGQLAKHDLMHQRQHRAHPADAEREGEHGRGGKHRRARQRPAGVGRGPASGHRRAAPARRQGCRPGCVAIAAPRRQDGWRPPLRAVHRGRRLPSRGRTRPGSRQAAAAAAAGTRARSGTALQVASRGSFRWSAAGETAMPRAPAPRRARGARFRPGRRRVRRR